MVVIVVAVRVEGESICLFDGWGRKKRKRCKGVGEERRYLKRVRRLIGRLCINPCCPPLRNLNFFFLFFFLAFLARGARVQLRSCLVAPGWENPDPELSSFLREVNCLAVRPCFS